MRSINSLSWLSVLASLTTSVPAINAQNSSVEQWPLHDNGLNDVVQWDHYSFKVNGKRLFVFSGELHYWRIPAQKRKVVDPHPKGWVVQVHGNAQNLTSHVRGLGWVTELGYGLLIFDYRGYGSSTGKARSSVSTA